MKPRAALSAVLLLLVCAVFALAACGGDDKEEFISDADEICKNANEDLENIDEPTTDEELAPYLNEALDLAEDVQGDLEDLDPPDDVQDDWDQYLENTQEGLDIIEDARDQAEAGDTDTAQETLQSDEVEQLDEENEELANDIGLEECGES